MAGNWTDVASRDAVPDGGVICVVAGDTELALYGVAGAVYATDILCTHGQALLCEGKLEGFEIECPLHQGRFDVRDGSATYEPATDPVRSYPVNIENGRILVDLG